MNENYPSASQVVRNLSDLRAGHRVIEIDRKFRIVELDAPFFEGYQFWVVNEKGFMWEPAESVAAARIYLSSDEAIEYQASQGI